MCEAGDLEFSSIFVSCAQLSGQAFSRQARDARPISENCAQVVLWLLTVWMLACDVFEAEYAEQRRLEGRPVFGH